ncbi:phosphotransferase [Amycolatopsis sp. w19]|uniref:phosphotransferase n=1 Tax=Amycolatopsis sp. w19 TaxID=3448134 RepID=UPI003F1D314D
MTFEPGSRVDAAVLRLGDPNEPDHCQRFAIEVAALQVAREHQLPAARLIATDLDGSAAGALAVLTTVLPGTVASHRPPPPSDSRAWEPQQPHCKQSDWCPRLLCHCGPARSRMSTSPPNAGKGATPLLTAAE